MKQIDHYLNMDEIVTLLPTTCDRGKILYGEYEYVYITLDEVSSQLFTQQPYGHLPFNKIKH